ncbi:MAG: winged helix-turn-helix transcriptional regulator [Planctomycetaceae bacterium]|nr:winged helix-turn-helix transcriptional regulator [Planctomycetaceae bacterium]
MNRDADKDSSYVESFELEFREQDEVQRRATLNDEQVAPCSGYSVELGGNPIQLDFIEFRILRFLAKSPYRAYTKKQIVQAVSSEEQRLREDELGAHIASLRGKLGLFSDYVQSVPHVGYRFKA